MRGASTRASGDRCALLHLPLTPWILGCLRIVSGAMLLVLIAVAPVVAQQGDLDAILKRFSALYNAGNYSAALVEAQKFEAVVKARSGVNHSNYGSALNNLALVYQAQGNYADAEALYRRTMAIKEHALGTGHPDVAMSLYNLANVYRLQGKYDEAGKLYKRALAIEEKALGTSHPQVANTLNGLALVHHLQGDYTNAEELYKRAIVILQKALGANHLNVTLPVSSLANVYQEQGKYREAEALHKRVLAIREHALGTNHPDVAQILNNLANDYQAEGNYDEAEVLHQRALTIRERTLGMSHPDVAESLYNLAFVERWQGKYREAEGFFKRALAIEEVTLGTSHPEIARTFQGLANVYYVENKYAAAEELYKRALAISEQTLGMSHLDVAFTLNNLGNVYTAQDKYRQAEEFFKRALAIREKALGMNHPDVAWTRNDLALLFAKAGNIESALEYARKSTATLIAHAATETPIPQRKFDAAGLRGQRNAYFLHHLAYLDAAVQERDEPLAAAAREAFDIAQWANQSSAATAIQQLGLRFAAGDGALAALVRENQDLTAIWRERDKALIAALSKPDAQQNPGAVDALRNQIAEIETKIAANALRLEKQFPDYAAMANPKPLKTDEVQQLLGDDEALVLLMTGQQHWETYVFAMTREGFEWKTIPLGTEVLEQKVAAFRRGLDVDALYRGLERLECTQAEADKRGLARVECGRVVAKECEEAGMRGLARADCAPSKGPHELFDLGLAHELYETLIGPVEGVIRDKRHLIVVPSGPLTALPFHLLVTEKMAMAVPQVNAPHDLAPYRDAAWLLKRHAVSVLPSVASLKALRVFARKDQAKNPLIGFGDPVFNAEEESRPAPELTRVAATRSYTDFWKGADIDRAVLSKALPAATGDGGRAAGGRAKSRRAAKQHLSEGGSERDDGEALDALRLPRGLFRHARPRRRRGQGTGGAVARAVLAEASERCR